MPPEDHECVFTDEQRKEEIVKVIKVELGSALDEYFAKNPFMVDAKQHFQDHEMARTVADNMPEWKENHEWTSARRHDLEIIGGSFLKSIGSLIAAAIVGAIGWKYLGKALLGWINNG